MKVNHRFINAFLRRILPCIFILIGCHLAGTQLSSTGKAYFLVQTGANAYHLLEVKKQTSTPYDFPGENQQYDLAAGLSPNGTHMIRPISGREVDIINLSTSEIETTYVLELDSPIFQPEQAVETVKKILPELNYSDQKLIMSLDYAHRQSLLRIKWFRDEGHLLSVLEGSENSTHLVLDHHQTGTREQLEGEPGMVEDYWVEPGGESILLKKGYIFDNAIWQDDRYYLVDPDLRVVSAIPLPPSSENPQVFWFAPDSIGVIHRPGLLGGTNFSMINAVTMESNLILEGDFTGIASLASNLLSYHQNHENRTTKFLLRTHLGQIIETHTMEGLCSVKATVNSNQLLINCEDQSWLLREDPFSITVFGNPVHIVSPSPDPRQVVILFDDQKLVVFSDNLVDGHPLQAQEIPDEIIWLPDFSGFLYRAMAQLYYYDLDSQEDHLLISSDFFIDYRNLNAVWVEIKED